MRREIVVPASVSNLGPGFDALAVAVNLFLRVRVVERRPSAAGDLECVFIDGIPVGSNRIAEAFARACERFGPPGAALTVEVTSDIPQRAGLGSSAAAAVAGLRLYELVAALPADHDWLPLATELEGHPDNAAAALHGGFVVACQLEDGRVVADAAAWPEGIALVAITPERGLETRVARGVLPERISLRDAVFNLQHALLLARALPAGDDELIREAMRDRWHQAERSKLIPGLREALALDHPALLGVCLAGAGPTVVALSRDPARVAPVLQTLYDRLKIAHTMRTLTPCAPFAVPTSPPVIHT